MSILALGSAGLAWSWPTSGAWTPAVWMFVCGAGTGIFISPNSSALMGSAPQNRQGIAGGVMALARNLGMALGVAVGSGLFASVLADRHGPLSWSQAADGVVQLGFGVGAGLALLAGAIAFAAPMFRRP